MLVGLTADKLVGWRVVLTVDYWVDYSVVRMADLKEHL